LKKLALHWKIIIGMLLGVVVGFIAVNIDGGVTFITDWVKPAGTIFINLLKLLAVPLIVTSLIKGIADLSDISKFSRIGVRTLGIYLVTTLTAVVIGLTLVNIIQPGVGVDFSTVDSLTEAYKGAAGEKVSIAKEPGDKSPLQFLIDIVPSNIIGAMGDNGNMLQVIFFVIFFGISMLLLPEKVVAPIKALFDGLNEVVMKMVDLVMLVAPYAVFALIAALIVETQDGNLFIAMLGYAITVMLGLVLMIGFYLLIIYLYTGRTPGSFMKGMGPAQLVAFSTSSSMATLPVTMERVEEHLGVDKEVSSFVCPIGATINMDGTSLHQAVAAVFVCQVLGHDLTLADQFTLVLTATLASIGAAAVPSAGIIMLVIVLESVNFPSEYLTLALAMILSIDRPLDMSRTIVNVSGDATVSMLVGKSLGMLHEPHPKEWDDYTEHL
jgi:Na+/H+-dicarboxylate symporter